MVFTFIVGSLKKSFVFILKEQQPGLCGNLSCQLFWKIDEVDDFHMLQDKLCNSCNELQKQN